MVIIRLVMVHGRPQHTQYGHKTARLAPVLQMGMKGHVRPPSSGERALWDSALLSAPHIATRPWLDVTDLKYSYLL